MALRGAFDDLALPVTSYVAEYQVTSISQASGVIPASALVGATFNFLIQSGATALTLPTAAALYAQLQSVLQAAGLPNPLQNMANSVFFENGGLTCGVRISNSNAGALTVTTGAGITLTGSFASIATTTTIDAILTFTSPTTATLVRVGSGAQ
jgi:hypothetical protein